MAKGKVGQTAVWILLGLLILGLGGFGVTNFGGSVRSIGSVNGQDISTNAYFRALRQDMNAVSAQFGRSLGFAEYSSLNLDGNTRARLLTTALMDAEMARLGLSVGDARLAEEIRGMQAFQSATGAFDRTVYRMSLEQNAWSEPEFETRMRADIARSLLQTALASGFVGSDAAAQAFFAHLGETRNFSMLRLGEADLTAPIAVPDEATLRAHHAANPEAFTRPEARRITYAAVLPQDVMSDIPANEDELRATYAARLSEFVQPERRLVERLIFSTDAQAEAARNRLDAGVATFDDLVAERGLRLEDVDMGDVSAEDLGAAAEAVFALEDPDVVGPLPSPLGPALYRMNGILAAQEVSFEAARDQLMAEFAMDAARRMIADRVDDIDDLLAGGATLEDLAQDAGMTLATIDLVPGFNEGIAAYPEFGERAARAREGDFPEAFALADGGLVALRLDATLPPTVLPYDDISDDVTAHWQAATLRAALQDRMAQIEAALAEGASLSSQGVVEVHAAMPRDGRVDRTPPDFMQQVYALQPGETRAVVAGDFVALVRLDAVQAADTASADAVQFSALISQQFGQQIGQDAFELFTRALETDAKIRLDQAAIDAVHTQMR